MSEKPTYSESSRSYVVLQRRFRPDCGIPETLTKWHDHPERYLIAWDRGQYSTLEENLKHACEKYYSIGQGCEYRMVRRTEETLWEYSADVTTQRE